MRVYVGQTKLTIRIQLESSLEGVESALIHYRKPDKTTGFWEGEIKDEVYGTVEHEVESGDIDLAGVWTFWISLLFNDEKTLVTDAAKMRVYKVGFTV